MQYNTVEKHKIFIGKKDINDYVLSLFIEMQNKKEAEIEARGTWINKALMACNSFLNKYKTDVNYNISISLEPLTVNITLKNKSYEEL